MLYRGKKIWFDKKGYAVCWIDGKSKKVHVLEWEKHNGAKPDKMEIHHINEDKGNWNIKNLLLLSKSDHQKVHAGWVKKNNEWYKKPCTRCSKLLLLSKFYQRNTANTPSALCKMCDVDSKKVISKFFEKRTVCKFCDRKATFRTLELCKRHYQIQWRKNQ